MGETISIPESVPLLNRVLTELARHPALSPLSPGVMVELPCCGMRVDAEGINTSDDGPSRVYWPPRWTCPQCDQTFTAATGRELTLLSLHFPPSPKARVVRECIDRLQAIDGESAPAPIGHPLRPSPIRSTPLNDAIGVLVDLRDFYERGES